ncbi:MAG: LD-carboxypeptidase [Chitinophagaceae bacterium]|nr:LD-carboxypeptidase [Chitinophagaceae bacterium]
MISIPPYLKKGDIIGIVCPAGYMSMERITTCISTLEDWGYRVQKGKTLESNSGNYFAGEDRERLEDLQTMLDDQNIRAILCGRGGYGTGRIIDQLDFTGFQKYPKWVIGFSDITVLHSHINSNYNIATLHGPMAGAFNNGGALDESVLSLRNALEGRKTRYTCPPHAFNHTGCATGELVGGNLSILAHLTGTASDIATKDRILFLEDVGEYLYNIDRMLFQLKRSGKLEGLSGLIIGGFTDVKDTVVPYGKSLNEIIHAVIKDFSYPVCFGFPVSHGTENYALKTGVSYNLNIEATGVLLEEQGYSPSCS